MAAARFWWIGGIRTGVDVFKALALGADAVLIARPFVNAIYGAGAEGVQVYVDKLAGELADTMSYVRCTFPGRDHPQHGESVIFYEGLYSFFEKKEPKKL